VHRTVVGGLAVRCARHGDVLVVAGRGAFTIETSSSLRVLVRSELDRQDARGIVLDLRGVVYLLTDEGWERLAEASIEAAGGKHAIHVPIAVVVDEIALKPAKHYCRRLARHDQLRLAFTEYAPAVSWASRRMEHWGWAPAQ
jgi:hypothetical protein